MHTELLRSQKNQIFNLIKENDLETSDFVWTKVRTRWPEVNSRFEVETLTHRTSGHYFVFDRYQSDANPRCKPGADTAGELDVGRLKNWPAVLATVRRWLRVLRAEVLEPDLWELAAEDKKLVTAKIEDLDNAPFTPDEQHRIHVAISELGQFLKSTVGQSEANLKFIESRLQHLESASSRLGRKDWITLAMGTLTNIVVGVALSPESARELVRIAGSLLGWVVGSVQLLL